MTKIFALAKGLFSGWQAWAGVAAVCAGFGLYIGWLRWDIDTYKTKVAQYEAAIGEAERVNRAAVDAIEYLENDRRRIEKALADTHKEALRNAARASALAKEIERVPNSENCAVGPAARGVVDRLLGTSRSHPDGTEGGQAGGPGRAKDVPKPTR